MLRPSKVWGHEHKKNPPQHGPDHCSRCTSALHHARVDKRHERICARSDSRRTRRWVTTTTLQHHSADCTGTDQETSNHSEQRVGGLPTPAHLHPSLERLSRVLVFFFLTPKYFEAKSAPAPSRASIHELSSRTDDLLVWKAIMLIQSVTGCFESDSWIDH